MKSSRLHLDGVALALLHPILISTTSLALRSREAHWNVKGPNFGPLHELFGDFYDFTNDWADTLAERIVQQGGVAVALSGHDGPPFIGDEKTLIEGIAYRANVLAEAVHSSIVQIDADETTKDALIEFGRELEKWIWKIESHLQEFKKVQSAEVEEVGVTVESVEPEPEVPATTTLGALPQETFDAKLTDNAIIVMSSLGRVFVFDENCRSLSKTKTAGEVKAAAEWLKANFNKIVTD